MQACYSNVFAVLFFWFAFRNILHEHRNVIFCSCGLRLDTGVSVPKELAGRFTDHMFWSCTCVCVYLLPFWTSVYPCSVKSLSSCTAVANVIEIAGHKSTSIGHLCALQLPTSVVTAHCSYCRNETLVYTVSCRSVC